MTHVNLYREAKQAGIFATKTRTGIELDCPQEVDHSLMRALVDNLLEAQPDITVSCQFRPDNRIPAHLRDLFNQ